jgi:TolB-like protein
MVPGRAVFLSYASQDAEAAQRLCTALRAAGVEVWFDQSELRGGDAWDALIRRQIKGCYLFVPIISANTQSREEGYFRREWNLAVARTLDMAGGRAFVLPIIIDSTPDSHAIVPEKFREFQWTRLPAGGNTNGFVKDICRLLLLEAMAPVATTVWQSALPTSSVLAASTRSIPRTTRSFVPWIVGGLLSLVLGYLVVHEFVMSKRSVPAAEAPGTAAAPAFNPPPHSIAVLPFTNISGDKEQDYFSDGLSEELLNSLARINELQVAARTSSFSFRGEHADLATIAHKLNVASVLEGSVRRSGQTIRVTAQLNNAVTGYHLWSQTYDRDLGDVLKLQTDIANAVAGALKIRLFGDVASRVEIGGTRSPAAFDAYLRASNAYRHFGPVNLAAGGLNEEGLQSAIAGYTDAIHADPDYALGYAGRSLAFADFARALVTGPGVGDNLNRAQSDARRSIALAPDLADSHLALANFLAGSLAA